MYNIKTFRRFATDCISNAMSGSRTYHLWMGFLTFVMIVGTFCYARQLDQGLSITGMNDSVSWGLYISNFTFLVGLAAAAVMLVLPTYILKDVDFSRAVLIGEGLAVAALIMCLAFVTVDLGSPAKAWHLLPIIGLFNWPASMLSWDVIVLNGYLFINITIPFYILYTRYNNKEPKKSIYLPGVLISVFWAVSIHLVTAFLYSGIVARPFWNNALLGPRFLASAFAAGPAMFIIILGMIDKFTSYRIEKKLFSKLTMIVTVAAQINLIMLFSELFKEFYAPTHHSLSSIYLYFGLDGNSGLVSWMYFSLVLNILATVILTSHLVLKSNKLLTLSCLMLFLAIWIEKGMGLIIPGFIPGVWGDIIEYTPTLIEIGVTFGIWALGGFVFTFLVKSAIAIEEGNVRNKS